MGWDDGQWGRNWGDGRGLPVAPGLAGSPSSLREFDATDIAGAYATDPVAFQPQAPSIMDRISLAIGKAQETHGYLFQNPAFVEMGKRTQDETLKKLEAHQAVREFTALANAREKHVQEERALAEQQREAAARQRAFDDAQQMMPGLVPKVSPTDVGPPSAAAPGGMPSFDEVSRAIYESQRGNPALLTGLMARTDFDPNKAKAIQQTLELNERMAAQKKADLDPETMAARLKESRLKNADYFAQQTAAAEERRKNDANPKPGEAPSNWIERLVKADPAAYSTSQMDPWGRPALDPVAAEAVRQGLVDDAIDRIPSSSWRPHELGELFRYVDTKERYNALLAALNAKYKGSPPAELEPQVASLHRKLTGAK